MRAGRDRGSASILAVALLLAVVLLTAMAVPATGALLALHRASAAADAAALAAADTLSGRASGYPCDNAQHAAQRGGAELTACASEGLIASVEVASGYAGVQVRQRARAGPPGSR